MSDNSNEFGAFMSGLLLGGIAGAITALLLAPQSGEETRKVIVDKSLEIKDKALETVDEARVRAEKAAEDARIALGRRRLPHAGHEVLRLGAAGQQRDGQTRPEQHVAEELADERLGLRGGGRCRHRRRKR